MLLRTLRDGWLPIAGLALAALAAIDLSGWLLGDRLPPGDFAGYAAAIEQTAHWWTEYGRIPRWCVACHGGASVFTFPLKETLALPLALHLDPVDATKWTFVVLRWLAALGMAWLFARLLRAPWIGIAAGGVYAFGAWANHEVAHLEVPLAMALLPPLIVACVETLRGDGPCAPVALAALAAVFFVNGWVQALAAGLACVLLWATGAWRSVEDRRPSPPDDRRRRVRRIAAALGLAGVLGASSLAWLVADAGNHRLLPLEVSAEQRKVWSLRTPLVLVNREGALASWLEEHPPPGPPTWRFDRGNRYAGVVLLLVAVLGAVSDRRGRRAMAWAGVLLLGMLSLAAGPYTLLGQLGGHLGVGDALVWMGRAGVVAALIVGLGLRRREPERFARIVRGCLPLGIALALASWPTWEILAALVPPLRLQRSPGQLAHLAPFPLALLFGLGLRGLVSALPSRRVAAGVVVAVLLATVWDFAPSARVYEEGAPMELVRRARRAVSSLPVEDETVRLALGPVYSPLQSLIVENAGPGFASGWLSWQAGAHWSHFLETAVWPTGPAAEAPEAVGDRIQRLERGRVRYLLRQARAWPRPDERLPPPWHPVRLVGPFEIWEQPRVGPFAVHHPASRHAASGPDAEPGAALEWQRLAPEQLRIALPEASSAGRVVVSQSFHPWWRARVDGVDAPIERVEESFLGVPVGPGARKLELEFRPPLPVVAAEVVSLVGWGVVALGLGWRGLRRRSRSHARDGLAPEASTRSPAVPRFD